MGQTPTKIPSPSPPGSMPGVRRVLGRPPPSRGRRVALLVFLLSPLLVLALLVFLIFQAQKSGLKMREPPVGAGAGHTGMYNEYSGLRPAPSPPK